MSKMNYLDKNGLEKLMELLGLGHKKIWHGKYADWKAKSAVEQNKYNQCEASTDLENDGLLFVSDAVRLNDLNAVTSNAVKRKLGSWVGTIEATPSADSASNPDYNTRDVWMYRSGNVGHIYFIPRSMTFGTNINSTSDEYGPPTKYGQVDFKVPEGMKLAPMSFDGCAGDVYDYPEHIGATYSSRDRGLDDRTVRAAFWIYPNDGIKHDTNEAVYRTWTWMNLFVLFDDDWHA